jgi:Domain of unknown function (DUF6089)
MSRILILFFSLMLISNLALAQNFEIGLILGVTGYNGDVDIEAKNVSSTLQPGIGIVGKYRLSNHLLLRGQLLSSKLSASEKNHSLTWRQLRGFEFHTQLTELTGMLEWEVFQKNRTSFFVFGGAGATFFKPTTNYNEPNPYIVTDINTDAKANFSKITAVIPVGLGVKYELKNNFYLSFEAGVRTVFTDYLDGISTVANPDKNDMYLFSGLTLTKAFGGGKKGANRLFQKGDAGCPKF